MPYNLSGPYSATNSYRMNASNILNTVVGTLVLYEIDAIDILNAISGTLAYYGVDVTIVLSTIAKVVFSTVFGFVLKTVLEQAIKRYSNRKRSQLNQFYRDVKVFQEILQETEKSVAGTGDNYARQLLEKNLDKCQKVCNQIESQSLAGTFLSSSQQVEELDLLLRNSIHITNTYLSASSAGMKADLRHLRAVVHNMQAGMCQLQVREALVEPNKVKKLIVEERKPGILHVSWTRTAEADYYEVQYDRQTGHSIKVSSTQCLLDSMQLHFPSKKFYNIHVRGVNGFGPGEWSESAVGKFTILPKQPKKPLAVHANSSVGIALVMEKPVEREGAKPVTHFVVEYHTDADKRCIKKVFPVNNLEALTLEGKEAVKINLNDRRVNTTPTYHVLVSHRNEDGDSLPCVDCIDTDRITPDVPVGLEVAYRNSHGILIEWKNTNACVVDHYEVYWELNKDIMNTEVTKNCYAVEQFLRPNKSYLIKVRAVNRRSLKSEFTEIRAKTKSNAGILIPLLVVIIILYAIVQQYMPIIKFSVPVVAMIATFLFISTKHVGNMHYLFALVLAGNVFIGVVLDLWYPVEIFNPFWGQVQVALTFYIGFFNLYHENMQLVYHMYTVKKYIVSTELKEQLKKRAMQNNLSELVFITFGSTLLSFASLQFYNYLIPMSYMYLKSVITWLITNLY